MKKAVLAALLVSIALPGPRQASRLHQMGTVPRQAFRLLANPTTGGARCCARAASARRPARTE
jgi:hypothetical protein